jgi:hypothetical protein
MNPIRHYIGSPIPSEIPPDLPFKKGGGEEALLQKVGARKSPIQMVGAKKSPFSKGGFRGILSVRDGYSYRLLLDSQDIYPSAQIPLGNLG